MPTFGEQPESVHAAVRALFEALGEPTRVALRNSPTGFQDEVIGENFHPVFALAEHFLSKDSYETGFTGNGERGDHTSVPCYSEHGEVAVLELGFHKGDLLAHWITYPNAPAPLVEALIRVLSTCETR